MSCAIEDTVAHDISLLRIDIGELSKKFAKINSAKVDAVEVQGTTNKVHESKLENKAKYVDHQLPGFRSQGQGNEVQNYYDYRDKYILPGRRDAEANMKEMLSKMMNGQESQ